MGLLDNLLKKTLDKVKDSAVSSVTNAAHEIKNHAVGAVTGAASDKLNAAKEKISDAVGDKLEEKFDDIKKKRQEKAQKKLEEALKKQAQAGSDEIVHPAPTGIDAFWHGLEEKWEADQKQNEGYVWTITFDSAMTLNAAELVDMDYELKLSASHVGLARDGVYRGSLAMKYQADLGGLSGLMAAMGGVTSSNNLDGWFRNDNFVMELTPYNKEKEDAFIHGLDTVVTDGGEIVPKNESDPYTDAIVTPILQQMDSGDLEEEKANAPLSYWFDWDYHMTEGKLGYGWGVTGVMGIGSAYGTIDNEGKHIQGWGKAVSPLGGVFTDRYSEDFESPFPYVIRVYESGLCVFELHSPMGGPVRLKFYGTLDRIPVSETTVVTPEGDKESSAGDAAAEAGAADSAATGSTAGAVTGAAATGSGTGAVTAAEDADVIADESAWQ